MGLAYQHHGNRCDPSELLGIASQQQPVHAPTSVGAQHHQLASGSQCLLRDKYRDALALALQKDGLYRQAFLSQPERRLVQQLLPGRQEAWPYFFKVNSRNRSPAPA